ncbi:MAG: VWA domain-containing protein [Vicinamibacterales bacterium]
MTRAIAVVFVAVLALTTVSAQRAPLTPDAAGLIEIDVVVLDRSDQPITGLRREDFTVREDGRSVDLKTFSAVTALGSTQPDDGRVVVLLMDDIGVPSAGTWPMQQIAPVVLSPIGDGDELSVVRLASHSDEAFGDIGTARDRIDGYRGGAVPFSTRDTPETMLEAIARIAGQLEPIDHRRKVILCLGLPAVCDVGEPQLGGSSVIWPAWVAAIRAAARANASVYCVDPTGARGGLHMAAGGLVQLTGGAIFSHQNDFSLAANAIWREAGHYYLLGYWPAVSKHELRNIEVSVARKGVHIRARRRR